MNPGVSVESDEVTPSDVQTQTYIEEYKDGCWKLKFRTLDHNEVELAHQYQTPPVIQDIDIRIPKVKLTRIDCSIDWKIRPEDQLIFTVPRLDEAQHTETSGPIGENEDLALLRSLTKSNELSSTKKKTPRKRRLPKRTAKFIPRQDYQSTNQNEVDLTPYKCLYCYKLYSRNGNLQKHVANIHNKKLFSCNICPKTFTIQHKLKSHARCHTGERPFKCPFCPKSFTQIINSDLHLRTHTREKPYNCRICPKTFAQLANLQAHERTHTGERPFNCTFCIKSFAQLSQLKAHERIHTGQKPYRCTVCPESFHQLSNLQQHIKTHTEDKSCEQESLPVFDISNVKIEAN